MKIPKNGVGVAWWHPEELSWLSRSRRIMHPSHNDDNSVKSGVGMAWWHPEEIPWLSRSRRIGTLPTIMTIPGKWCRGVMAAP